MVTRYNFVMMEGNVWPQDAGMPASWENSRRVSPKAEFVAYEDYAALETRLLALLNHPVMKAHTEALREAQTTGLAFIRVNANGHAQALPSDRIRISVIQAVEERTAAATHPELGDAIPPRPFLKPSCDHIWTKQIGTVWGECVKCGAQEDDE